MVIGWKWPGWFILPNVGWFTHMENQWPFWSTTLSIGWSSTIFLTSLRVRWLDFSPEGGWWWSNLFCLLLLWITLRITSQGWGCPQIHASILLLKLSVAPNLSFQYHSRPSPPLHVTRGRTNWPEKYSRYSSPPYPPNSLHEGISSGLQVDPRPHSSTGPMVQGGQRRDRKKKRDAVHQSVLNPAQIF